MNKENYTANSEVIEEVVDEEHDIVFIYPLLEYLQINVQKKRTELFKNLVVSFRKSHPLSNFINNDEGPIFDFDELLKHDQIKAQMNEDGDYAITNTTKVFKAHCPICGCELKEPFTIKNFYEDSEEDSTYFNQKVVYLKNPNLSKNTPKQISFNYISCPECMRSIVANYNTNGKPLVNSNLLKLYQEISKFLGLELDNELNAQTNARCLYPVDRLYFKSKVNKNFVFYFNLFMMCEYASIKFKEYWNKIGKSELDYENEKMIVFTEMTVDIFNPNKFKEFREFENWLLEEVKEDFLNGRFVFDQFKNFKFKIFGENLTETNIEVQCEKCNNCQHCSGRLKLPSLRTLFSLIPLRKTEATCIAKKYQIANLKPLQPQIKKENNENKQYLQKEEISTEEIQTNKIIEKEKEIKMGNDAGGILPPEEEAKLESSQNIQQEEIQNENIQEKEEISTSQEDIQEEKKEEISEENKEESIIDESKDSNLDVESAEETKEEEKNNEEIVDLQIQERPIEEIGNLPIPEKEEALIEPLIEKSEENPEKIIMSFEDNISNQESLEEIKNDSPANIIEEEKEIEAINNSELDVEKHWEEENSNETDNAIFEKAINDSEKSLLEDMANMEDEKPTYQDENTRLINEAINTNNEMSLVDKLYNAIILANNPSQEDFLKTYEQYVNGLENENEKSKLRTVPLSEKFTKGMELYIDYQIQDIYRDCDFSGKEILNKYPGISYEDLQEYMFDKTMRREIQESRIENDLQTRVKIESASFNYDQTRDVEDSINQSNDFLRKQKEKEQQISKKNEDKCNIKAVFRTKDIKRNNPFVMQAALRDSYQKSPFRVVIDMVLKMDGYRAGAPIITIEKDSLFVPIIDFADVGIRFVCIDTTDTKYWTFQENPVKMVNRIPFPNQEFAYNHSLNFLYSNECLTNPQQVAFSIFKLVNRNFFPPEKIVRLAGRGYPIAYTIEKQALLDFEHDHSIFSGLGRAKQRSVTLIAFVDDANENKEYQVRKRMAERMSKGWRYDHDDYFNTYKNLLEEYQMCYILSAHYLFDEEINIVNGIEEKYIHYTITQYTENIYCIIEDGLPALITAIIKEHYRLYPNTPYSITFEFDRTALVSPSVRKLLNNTENIFNIDPTSLGQMIADTNTTWVISESRFQKNTGGAVDDRARQDYRYFRADEMTLRNFLMNKIRPDENLSNIEKVLASVGYYKYPEPKSQNFELTAYALDLLEHSSLFAYMFPIEIAKLGQDNAFDSYNNAYQEILTAKFMMENNLNVPGSNEMFQFIDQGARLVGQIVDWWKNK